MKHLRAVYPGNFHGVHLKFKLDELGERTGKPSCGCRLYFEYEALGSFAHVVPSSADFFHALQSFATSKVVHQVQRLGGPFAIASRMSVRQKKVKDGDKVPALI